MQIHEVADLQTAQGTDKERLLTVVNSSEYPSRYRDFRRKVLEKAERNYFSEIVFLAEGNLEKACDMSGLSRSRLYAFLRKHGISLRSGIAADDWVVP